jgi:hypothetical protein
METIELPTTIEGVGSTKGIRYEQIEKSDKAYIYKVLDSEVEEINYFEIFLRRTVPICLNFEHRVYSETQVKEQHPKDKDFGDWAWCCRGLDKALEKFKKINNGEETP